MVAIGDKGADHKLRMRIVTGCSLLLKAVLCGIAGSFLMTGAAFAVEVPLKVVAQMKVDDDGRPLSYPNAVFFDPVMEEIYLVNGGSGRVVVYGPDYFPRMSIGVGRGALAPGGGSVLTNGDVYIPQMRNVRNPRPRISILNGAFFVEREIFLDEIPEAAGFQPTQVAVSSDGILYVIGNGYRGVLVLDREGNFLRWLQPVDEVNNPQGLQEAVLPPSAEGEMSAEQGQPAAEDLAEMPSGEEDPYADIPEEFRPRKRGSREAAGPTTGIGPVRVTFVTIDSSGRIYLISDETSRVYVYGPDESFLFAFGQKGGSPEQQSQPKGMAIDEKRKLIYVVDYMRHTILAYNLDGDYLFEFGGRGYAPGWFNFPIGIAINKYGQLIVSDLFNKRVQVLEIGYEEIVPYLGKEPAVQDTADTEESQGDDHSPAASDLVNDWSAEPTADIGAEGDVRVLEPSRLHNDETGESSPGEADPEKNEEEEMLLIDLSRPASDSYQETVTELPVESLGWDEFPPAAAEGGNEPGNDNGNQ